LTQHQSTTKESAMLGLYRSRNGILGGVASGIARRIGVHPAVVRIPWLAVTPFAWVWSPLLYLGLAIVLPVEREDHEIDPIDPAPLARRAFAGFWALHGLAHAVGFAMAWRLVTASDGLAHSTLILWNRLDIGEPATRVLGLVWLAMVPFVVAAAAALAANARFALPLFGVSAAASLVLCGAYLPTSGIGFAIDLAAVALLAGLVIRRHLAPRVQAAPAC
jgi:phage shock protein PspC (stress-responsive transcriptional regulator)